jgi:O-antigen ligase
VVGYIFLSLNFTAFIGLIEYFNKGPLFDSYLISVDKFNEDIGIINIRDGIIRIKSVFAHPLIFAQFLLLNIFLTYHYLNQCKNNYKKAILVLILIASYFLMLQTDSRTGLFLAIVMPLFYLYFRLFSHKKTGVLVRALTTILIVFLAIFAAQKLPELLDLARQSHSLNMQGQIEAKDLSSLARITQLDLGSEAFIDSPLYGYGLGQALYNIPQLRALDNYYLTLLLEIGALGLFLFLSVIFLVMKKSIKQIRYRYDPFILTIIVSISAILCFYLIISIPKINPILFVFLAILLSETRKANRNE